MIRISVGAYVDVGKRKRTLVVGAVERAVGSAGVAVGAEGGVPLVARVAVLIYIQINEVDSAKKN